jgi:hypothetical protein
LQENTEDQINKMDIFMGSEMVGNLLAPLYFLAKDAWAGTCMSMISVVKSIPCRRAATESIFCLQNLLPFATPPPLSAYTTGASPTQNPNYPPFSFSSQSVLAPVR